MDERQFQTLIERLDHLERRLTQLEHGPQPTQVVPPVVTPPPFQPKVSSAADPQATLARLAATSPQPPQEPLPVGPKTFFSTPADDFPRPEPDPKESDNRFEYTLGAKGLPLLGAGLTILAIIFFTTIAFTRGWITSEMIFGATVALCLGFIGTGQFLRDEKEQFGQILTGVGSCGLYITFAAGHFAQNLYPTATMLGLFVGLSLVNLGYGYWKASTAFLAIGVIGGFTASYLPLAQAQPQIPTHLLLHALITIPAALIIARHKWMMAAVYLLPVALLANAHALWMPGYEWLKVTSVYATLLRPHLLLPPHRSSRNRLDQLRSPRLVPRLRTHRPVRSRSCRSLLPQAS